MQAWTHLDIWDGGCAVHEQHTQSGATQMRLMSMAVSDRLRRSMTHWATVGLEACHALLSEYQQVGGMSGKHRCAAHVPGLQSPVGVAAHAMSGSNFQGIYLLCTASRSAHAWSARGHGTCAG